MFLPDYECTDELKAPPRKGEGKSPAIRHKYPSPRAVDLISFRLHFYPQILKKEGETGPREAPLDSFGVAESSAYGPPYRDRASQHQWRGPAWLQ